jgi:predicted ribosome quality control (RQC) complex YloA/Tae2 family protein
LIIELTGRSSNMLLIDAEKVIIDALRRVATEGSIRRIAPGERYCPPEIIQTTLPEPDIALAECMGQSANAAVDKFYASGQGADNRTDLLSLIKKSVTKKRKKLKRRLESIAIEEQRQFDTDSLKQSGELLLAKLHTVKRGMESVEIFNYYLQPPAMTTVLLEPRLSPADNAARYFKQYKKAKRGQEHSKRRLQETQDELNWLDSIDYSLQEAVSAAEIEEIAAECRQNGLLQAMHDRYDKKSVNLKSAPLETISPSGFKVLCGRNNKQNDNLTTKVLKAADLWFHAYQCPGAHVVLKGAGSYDSAPEGDLLFAAALAAGHSRSRDDSKVEVMIAEPKHVIKPKGAKPGLVLVRQYKTVIVRPLRIA